MFVAWLRNAVAVLPACAPALPNRLSTSASTAVKLLAESVRAVPSAVVPVFNAPVRSSTPLPACLSVVPTLFALPLTLAIRPSEDSSRCRALWVSVLNVRSVPEASVSVSAKSLILPLNCVSCSCAAGLSSWLASCDATLSAVLVSVSENVSLTCALTVSAPWPVIFGAKAFFFSLL